MVRIRKIDEKEYEIDGMSVYKNHHGKWVGHPALSPQQIAAFQRHLKSEARSGMADQ